MSVGQLNFDRSVKLNLVSESGCRVETEIQDQPNWSGGIVSVAHVWNQMSVVRTEFEFEFLDIRRDCKFDSNFLLFCINETNYNL